MTAEQPVASVSGAGSTEKVWHLGHVAGTVIVDGAELAQLRADLEAARSERDYWQEAFDGMVQRGNSLSADLAQARARIEKLEAVAEAADGILAVLHWTPQLHPKIVALGVALHALDAAQAAGAGQEQPCCSQDQPHTSNPKCPAGEKHWVSSQWSWAERPELQLADDDVEPPGEPGSYKRAIGALGGKELRMSPETAVRRGRDNDRSEPVQTDVATSTRAEGPQEAI